MDETEKTTDHDEPPVAMHNAHDAMEHVGHSGHAGHGDHVACSRPSSCPARGYAKMKQNLWWAADYTLISVPLAAGVLAPIGFLLPMSVGTILMSLSAIVVALNAQLLRRLDLRPQISASAPVAASAVTTSQ